MAGNDNDRLALMRMKAKDGHTRRRDFVGVDDMENRNVYDESYASNIAKRNLLPAGGECYVSQISYVLAPSLDILHDAPFRFQKSVHCGRRLKRL